MKRVLVVTSLGFIILLSVGVFLFRAAAPVKANDPFLRAAQGTDSFDPSVALTGGFREFHRFEQLPSGLQKALWTVRRKEAPFDPKCVMANTDEPVNTDVMLPGVCTGTYFLFGGVSEKAAFVAYSEPNGFFTTHGVIVFSLAGRGGVWQASLDRAAVSDVESLRKAIASNQYRQTTAAKQR